MWFAWLGRLGAEVRGWVSPGSLPAVPTPPPRPAKPRRALGRCIQISHRVSSVPSAFFVLHSNVVSSSPFLLKQHKHPLPGWLGTRQSLTAMTGLVTATTAVVPVPARACSGFVQLVPSSTGIISGIMVIEAVPEHGCSNSDPTA